MILIRFGIEKLAGSSTFTCANDLSEGGKEGVVQEEWINGASTLKKVIETRCHSLTLGNSSWRATNLWSRTCLSCSSRFSFFQPFLSFSHFFPFLALTSYAFLDLRLSSNFFPVFPSFVSFFFFHLLSCHPVIGACW